MKEGRPTLRTVSSEINFKQEAELTQDIANISEAMPNLKMGCSSLGKFLKDYLS
jgi:hypothetical protein